MAVTWPSFSVGHVGVHDKMVICAIASCGSQTPRDKEKSFYRLPSILIHQGTQTETLSRERQQAWLAKIKEKIFCLNNITTFESVQTIL